jgi:ribosomal-protein-alanine acetyltransferase
MNAQPIKVHIRPMREVDITRVLEIADALPTAPHWPLSAWLDALDPAAQLRRKALVAEDPGKGVVLGFAVASVLAPQAELETIGVSTEAQRRGIARYLFATLAAELKQAHITEVTLEVRASNGAALQFYRALGFREAGRRRRYYADPEEDAVLLRLTLL